MEAFVIIVTLVAVILICAFSIKEYINSKRYPPTAFSVNVVAEWGENLIVRNERGELGILRLSHTKKAKVGDKIMVEHIPDSQPNGVHRFIFATPGFYLVATKEAKLKAQIIRRLNDEIVLCRLEKDEIFVSCTSEQQLECEMFVSIGTKIDYDDQQAPQSEETLVLPVSATDGVFVIPECRQL